MSRTEALKPAASQSISSSLEHSRTYSTHIHSRQNVPRDAFTLKPLCFLGWKQISKFAQSLLEKAVSNEYGKYSRVHSCCKMQNSLTCETKPLLIAFPLLSMFRTISHNFSPLNKFCLREALHYFKESATDKMRMWFCACKVWTVNSNGKNT